MGYVDKAHKRRLHSDEGATMEDEMKTVPYQLAEDQYLGELMEYIDATYSQHYAQYGPQTIVETMQKGDGLGCCRHNIRKYMDRYGHKDGYNRKDLLKLAHYAIFLIINHDMMYAEGDIENETIETDDRDT